MQKRNLKRIAAIGLGTIVVTLTAWPTELKQLSVRGNDIVDSDGHVMSMRGINFGGWLMIETWIPSIEMEWHDHLPRIAREAGVEAELHEALEAVGEFDDDTMRITPYLERVHQELKTRVPTEKYQAYMALFEREPSLFAAKDIDDILRKRFGDYGAARFWNRYHDQWIKETDFQLAKALGFNFVRLPFWYRWFENDQAQYQYNDYGFVYLDKAVQWANNHGLYLMLDFHGAVGGQSPWDHTGELSRAEFFSNEDFQKRTAGLWKHIAQRYKDEPAVWAFDALNEPFSAKGVEDWTAAHDRIYDAIREAAPETIIVMEEGYKLEFPEWMHEGFFPDPKKLGWDNVVYSFHFYSGADPLFTTESGLADHARRAEEVKRVGLMEQGRCNVPIYIGEFSTMGNHPKDIEGMEAFLTMFNELGWHWSPWTWKYVNDDGEGSIWGVYQYVDPWPGTPNMYRDSLKSILTIVEHLDINNFKLQEAYANVLRRCLSQPVTSAQD